MKFYDWIRLKWLIHTRHGCWDCNYGSRSSLDLFNIDRRYCEKHGSCVFNAYDEICKDWKEKQYNIPKTKIIKWDDEGD